MKNKLILVAFITFTLGCRAQQPPLQQIIPVENIIGYVNNDANIPDGIYFKDVNHLLDKYVGTWVGTYDNKTYEFQVVEFTDNYLGITEDILLMRYKITDANGNEIVNTLNLPNTSSYVISGKYLTENAHSYAMRYRGYESECGQKGTVFIEIEATNPNVMELFYGPQYEWIDSVECPNGVANQVFPTFDDQAYLILTKQ